MLITVVYPSCCQKKKGMSNNVVNNVQFPGLGLEFQINRVAFSIGGIDVYWYGLLIAIGFSLAVIYAMVRCKSYGISSDKLIDCVIVGLITAIIGARLYYVAFRWDVYKDDLMSILRIDNGGLAIYGGVIGGILGGLLVAKIHKIKFGPLLDLAAVGFLIGQCIGRWGNFTNQEAFGSETDNIFRMISERTGGKAVHPCFLYESVWCFLGVILLYIVSKKLYKFDGQLFLMYLVWYGFERMIVEGLRTDSLYLPFGNIRVSQLLSAILVIIGIVLLVVMGIRNKSKNKNKVVRA